MYTYLIEDEKQESRVAYVSDKMNSALFWFYVTNYFIKLAPFFTKKNCT